MPPVRGNYFNEEAQLTYNQINAMNKLYDLESPTALGYKKSANLESDTLASGNDSMPDFDCRRKYKAPSPVSNVGLPASWKESSQKRRVTREDMENARGSTSNFYCYDKATDGDVKSSYSRLVDLMTPNSSIYSQFDVKNDMQRCPRTCVCNKFPSKEAMKPKNVPSMARNRSTRDAPAWEWGRFYRSVPDTTTKININPTHTYPRFKHTAEGFCKCVPLQDHIFQEYDGPQNPCYIRGCKCKIEQVTGSGRGQDIGKLVTSTKDWNVKRPCHIPGCECKQLKKVVTKMPTAVKNYSVKNICTSPSCYCKHGETISKTQPCTKSGSQRMPGHDVNVTKAEVPQHGQRLKQQRNEENRSHAVKGAARNVSNGSSSRCVCYAETPCVVQRQSNCVRSSTRK